MACMCGHSATRHHRDGYCFECECSGFQRSGEEEVTEFLEALGPGEVTEVDADHPLLSVRDTLSVRDWHDRKRRQ